MINFIILSENKKGYKNYYFQFYAISILLFILTIVFGIGAFCYSQGMKNSIQYRNFEGVWRNKIEKKDIELRDIKIKSESQIIALSKQIGSLEADLTHLISVSYRLVKIAGLDQTDFIDNKKKNYNKVNKTLNTCTNEENISYVKKKLDNLNEGLHDESVKLISLEKILLYSSYINNVVISGKPVAKGWLSSSYGFRIDPFTSRRSWHRGVDIASKLGSKILATGDGIITWSGRRHNYGLLVEVSHGNGLVTRYAHNLKVLVKVGQIIKKGQTIALMGSSGRSTGPHVHYEVWKSRKTVNPYFYF